MNKQRRVKEQTVQEITEKLQNSMTAVITDYRGLNVAQATKLRNELREVNVEYKVLKNTLTKIAAQNMGLEELKQYLDGPTAIAFSTEDPVAPAKVLAQFSKNNKALEIKGGVLEGKVVSLDQIIALAELPSREELLAQVVRGMQSPLVGMANVLSGPLRNMVNVLDAVRKEKEVQA
ncbi:MAG: 50S ribosomal protein L10 [Desulfitibacter sp. BRH_c19]|nr:MAG: 50S ribosomal protein L10 [Desulfitibacter sp. BRH_c19]